jgi:formylglycine-generating enzyme required for sulfatase activity
LLTILTGQRMSERYAKPFPPPWAEAWGDDRYGLWAELLVNGVTQRMRWLSAGRFKMGSQFPHDEYPPHTVTLTEDLWLADTACTQALWLAVTDGRNPSHFTGNPDLPVEQVSWDDVQEFFSALQTQAALPTDIHAMLPTEAEWEYACRADSTTPFSFGEQITTELVNFFGNQRGNDGPKGEYRGQTVPVKALPANAWGLYQMHGNVWEWCADAQRPYTSNPVTNPSGRSGGGVDAFAVRGGSWFVGASDSRSARRVRSMRRGRSDAIGFRFALKSTGGPAASGPVFNGQSQL